MPYNILQEAEQGFIFSIIQRTLRFSITIRINSLPLNSLFYPIFVCVFDVKLYGTYNIE